MFTDTLQNNYEKSLAQNEQLVHSDIAFNACKEKLNHTHKQLKSLKRDCHEKQSHITALQTKISCVSIMYNIQYSTVRVKCSTTECG